MIEGDRVRLLKWDAIPLHTDSIGIVKNWREVGLQLHTISYEYLVMFGSDGPYFWVPERYLQRLSMDAL
jgi:hypothetical protein